MRKFLSTGLVLALVFSGALVINLMLKGLTAPIDVGIERAANMTLLESNDSNAVEVDGIRFEILVSERVWLIPENQRYTYTPIKLGIRITNHKQTAVHFTRFDPQVVLGLKIVGPDGLALQPKGGRDTLIGSKSGQLVCPLIQPGESVTFFLDANLYWRDNLLQLGGSDGLGGGWYFEALKPGTYKVRFIYSNHYSVAACYDPETLKPETTAPKILEGLWTGQATTPFVEVRLVQP